MLKFNKIIAIFPLIILLICSGCDKLNTDSSSNEDTTEITEKNAETHTLDLENIADESGIISKIDVNTSKYVLAYINKTDSDVNFGSSYDLQIQDTDNWIDIATIPNMTWTSALYKIAANETFEEVLLLESIFGKLSSGHYRIIREMWTEDSKFSVITEFDI